MNRLTRFLLLIQWIVLLPFSSVLGQTINSTQEGVEFIEGQIIVRFIEELGKSEVKSILCGTNFQVKKVLVRRLNIYLLSIEVEGITTPDALEEIRLFPDVKTAQLDHVVTMRQLFPDDEQFDDMWDMHNTGQLGGVEDADIDAPEAWEISTGGGTSLGDEIVVAVIDGGVDIDHEDLIDNLWVNVNEIPNNDLDDDENGYIDDIYGWNAYSSNGSIPSDVHGTHVTGTIGARGNNGTDVADVSWDVKIMAIAGASSQTSTVLEAYGYVLDQKSLWIETGGLKGANVVATNSSFGIDFADCESGDYPLWNDIYDSLGAVGILSAAAWFTAPDGNAQVNNSFSSDIGQSFKNPIRVDSGNPLGRVDLIILPENNFLVSWMEWKEEDAEVKVRTVTQDRIVGKIYTIGTIDAGRGSGIPQMVFLDNWIYLAWTKTGENTDIILNRFRASDL